MSANQTAKVQAMKAMETYFAKQREAKQKKATKPVVGALFKKARKQALAKQACYMKNAVKLPEEKENEKSTPCRSAHVAEGKIRKSPQTSESEMTRPLRLLIRLSKEDATEWKQNQEKEK